jgi:hypothetical protein
MRILLTALVLIGLVSCSSYKPKVVDNKGTIQKDYEVIDASSRYRPTWIEDANYWAKKEEMDTKNLQFYSFETSPRADRELACDMAKANVKADIAAQIQTKIEKNLDTSREDGQTALSDGGFVRSYISRSLKDKMAQDLVGVKIEKTYWEKRSFSTKLGATKDYVSFSCAVLANVQKRNIELAIDRAFNDLYKNSQAKDYKNQIEEAISKTLE